MDEKEAEACPVMGTIFLVSILDWTDLRVSRSLRSLANKYIFMSVCRMSVVCQINCVGGITYGPRACSKSFFGG